MGHMHGCVNPASRRILCDLTSEQKETEVEASGTA